MRRKFIQEINLAIQGIYFPPPPLPPTFIQRGDALRGSWGDPLTLACACSSASSDACNFSTKPEVRNLNQKEFLQYIKRMKFHTDYSLAHTSHTFSELFFFSAKMQKSHAALLHWLYCQWNQYCVNLLLRPWFHVSGGLTQRFLHKTHVENW